MKCGICGKNHYPTNEELGLITPLPEPEPTSEEIVRVQQVVRELAETFGRKAVAAWTMYEKASHYTLEVKYREEARTWDAAWKALRTAMEKLPNVRISD